ncbi:MAG: yisY [Myxococcales bacterium]|nr:yisY [Myxococcales bacterium]
MPNKQGSRFVQVEPGVRVWVEDVGRGLPIVFVHGWPASYRMFEYQMDRLPKAGARCIGIDTRGFGKSDKPWHGYDYDRLAEDLHVVIEELELERAVLVGFSMGGGIVAQYLSRYEDRVEKAVLLSAAVPRVTRTDKFSYGVERSVCDELIELAYADRPKMIAEFAKSFFYAPQDLSPDFRQWFAGICAEAAGHATIKCCELFRDADLHDLLPLVDVPTLILHGQDDKICKYELAEVAHELIPRSQLVPIKHAGHGAFYEQQARVTAEILSFAELSETIGVPQPGIEELPQPAGT